MISGPIDVCPDVPYVYTLSPSLPPGAGWSVNVVGGTLINQSGDDLTIEWFDNGGNNRIFVTLVNGPCGDIGPVELSVNVFDVTLPSMFNSTSPLCIGSTGQSSITQNAQITQYIWSGTGITILSGQGTSGPLFYTVDQVGTVEICLDVETTCGPLGPVCETLTVLDIPSPTIDPVNPTCDLEFTLNGVIGSGSSADWQIISGPNGGNILTPNNSTTTVQVTQSGTYVIQLTENNGTCTGTANVSVEILESPIVSDISFDCLGGSDDYVATITISGGLPPYTVNGDVASGNTYTFPSTSSGGLISVIIVDDNGCDTEIIINHDCPCISNAGTMSGQVLENCITSGISVTGVHNGDATLDNNDIGVYVLHTGNGTTLGTIIDINTTGIFDFQAGMTPGVTYYISYVVGNEVSGSIDLGDRCLSVAIGQPVIFYDEPTVIITSPTAFCPTSGFLEAVVIGGFTSVTWSQISGPGNVDIFNPNNILTNVSFAESGLYEFDITVILGPCIISERVEIEVFSIPQISDVEDICNGANEYTLSFDISDPNIVSDINIVGEFNGNTFTSFALDPSQVYNIVISLTNGCEVAFEVGPIDCACLNRSGSMGTDILSACISSGESVTATYNNDGAFQSGDMGLFFLHDNPGSTLGFVFDFNDTGEFTFQSGMLPGVIYYISYVVGQELGGMIDLNDPCLKVAIGQPVVFYSDPIILYSYAPEVCGLGAQFAATTNTLSETIDWRFISGPDSVVIENPQSEITNVSPASSGSYIFEIQVSNAACSASEEFTVNFNEIPVVDSIKTQCLQTEAFFLTFYVRGDNPPWTVNIPGSFDTLKFTSAPLRTDSLYNIIVTNIYGCEASFNAGPIQCDCLSASGSMSLDTIHLCETSGTVILGYNNDAILFPGDSSVFVIHEGKLDSLINPVFISDTLSFDIPNNLVRNQIYYVSHVVGPVVNGNIDFQSECLRVSQGQPLIIYAAPEFILPSDFEVCLDLISVFIENSQNGIIDIIGNSSGSLVDVSLNGDSLFIRPSTATELIFSYEENNGTCSAKDTLSVKINGLPSAININTDCVGDTFQTTFDISEGMEPYFVNGSQISGTRFESAFVASETVLSFTLTDANGCMSDTFDITALCNCAGTVGFFSSLVPISLCEGENIDLTGVNLLGFNQAPDQNLYYVLHDGDENNVGNIISLSQTRIIPWDTDIQVGETYYVTAILSSGTSSEINFTDPCLDISQGIPVVWESGPAVVIDGRIDVCLDDNISIEVQSTGPFPFSIILTNDKGDILNAIEITQPNQFISLPTLTGETIWSISDIISTCVAAYSGTFVTFVSEPQNVIFSTANAVCNNAIFESSLNLNSLLVNPDISGSWFYQGNEVMGGIFDFDGFLPGNYMFTFDTRPLENPCPGDVYTIMIEVTECLCPSVVLPDTLALCSSENTYSLNNLGSHITDGFWAVDNSNNNITVPTIIGKDLLINEENSGIYTLVYTVTDEVPEGCEKEFRVILDIERALSAGNLVQESSVFCDNINDMVDLNNWIEGGSANGEWIGMNGVLDDSNVDINKLETGPQSFIYRVPAGRVCPPDSTEVIINIIPSPEYILDKLDPICPEENFGSLIVQPINDPNLNIFLNGNPVTDIQLSRLFPGNYTLEVFNAQGCSGGEELIDIIPAPSYTADLGEDITVVLNTSAELKLVTDIPDSLILNITWEDEKGIFNTQDRIISYVAEEQTNIRVIITAINGCVYETDLTLYTRLPDIIMPNIFNPSGTGTNAVFGPVGLSGDINIKEFSIYDRWGNLLHTHKNKRANDLDVYWNGRYNGRDVQPGVYVYYLILESEQGDVNVYSGDVTIVR